jgi:hypothetical protein
MIIVINKMMMMMMMMTVGSNWAGVATSGGESSGFASGWAGDR